ncbi:MAG: RNA-binding S4 domain-containing protein [Clostridia bacterium]|nr:RNA-binding S4 domain-containing protein [Clostridia bacterium]
MDKIQITTPFIKLDQFLKFSDVVENGGDAKYIITLGCVSVNGEAEVRRGRKLYPGDVVHVVYEDADIELAVCE